MVVLACSSIKPNNVWVFREFGSSTFCQKWVPPQPQSHHQSHQNQHFSPPIDPLPTSPTFHVGGAAGCGPPPFPGQHGHRRRHAGCRGRSRVAPRVAVLTKVEGLEVVAIAAPVVLGTGEDRWGPRHGGYEATKIMVFAQETKCQPA